MVEVADVDDAVDDDVAFDELEGAELSLPPQAVANVSAVVNATPTPKIRTRPIPYRPFGDSYFYGTIRCTAI